MVVVWKKIPTPLGMMVAASDAERLYELSFESEGRAEQEEPGQLPHPLQLLEQELTQYFAGRLTQFSVPLAWQGTAFQIKTWQMLERIPYGMTASYAELALAIGQPTASRAVGTANGCNKFAIIIPCHRVIQSSGKLGGYASGVERKQWLLEHERRFAKKA